MNEPTQLHPFECRICHCRFRSALALDAHICALTERFFQQAIPRWRACGVTVSIEPTYYDIPGCQPPPGPRGVS
jgi:hypothetical protein